MKLPNSFLDSKNFLGWKNHIRANEKGRITGVTELGAHSLKFHSLDSRGVCTVKYPYALGHEVYTTGQISEPTTQQILEFFGGQAAEGTVAICTSAIRDAENREEILNLLQKKLGISFHVLSPWEEASLLAAGYLAVMKQIPALVFDLGGGSTEFVYLNEGKAILWDSIQVGAIRSYLREMYYGPENQEKWIEQEFSKSLLIHSREIHVTGGTAKAISGLLKKSTFSREDLEDLKIQVQLDGPPRKLKPERAIVFLPGLLLLIKLMDFVEARRATYFKITTGRTYLLLAQLRTNSKSSILKQWAVKRMHKNGG